MPSPLLQLRIPQDLADWLEAKYPSRGEVAEYVRQLLTAEQMKEAAAPLVPEYNFEEVVAQLDRDAPLRRQFAEQLYDVPSNAEFDAFKAKPKARRKDVRKVPDQPVSVMNRGGRTPWTQEPSSKSVKGSPAVMGSSDGSVGSNGQAAPPNKSAAESPSPKPRKPKTCQHSNIIRKLGQPFCTDCGEFV